MFTCSRFLYRHFLVDAHLPEVLSLEHPRLLDLSRIERLACEIAPLLWCLRVSNRVYMDDPTLIVAPLLPCPTLDGILERHSLRHPRHLLNNPWGIPEQCHAVVPRPQPDRRLLPIGTSDLTAGLTRSTYGPRTDLLGMRQGVQCAVVFRAGDDHHLVPARIQSPAALLDDLDLLCAFRRSSQHLMM